MKTRTLLKSLAIAGAVSLLVAGQAAALSIFDGEDPATGGIVPPGGNAASARQNFINALTGGLSVENFESFSHGNTANLSLTPIGGTLTGAGAVDDQTVAASTFGMFPTSGDKYWKTDGNFSVSFGAPIVSFGFFATDIGDHNGDLSVEVVRSAGGTTHAITHSKITGAPFGSTDFNLLFWGIIDTDNPFTAVNFLNSNPNTETFGFDDLSVGEVLNTPLPAALPLLLTALSALGLLGWRRRRIAA